VSVTQRQLENYVLGSSLQGCNSTRLSRLQPVSKATHHERVDKPYRGVTTTQQVVQRSVSTLRQTASQFLSSWNSLHSRPYSQRNPRLAYIRHQADYQDPETVLFKLII